MHDRQEQVRADVREPDVRVRLPDIGRRGRRTDRQFGVPAVQPLISRAVRIKYAAAGRAGAVCAGSVAQGGAMRVHVLQLPAGELERGVLPRARRQRRGQPAPWKLRLGSRVEGTRDPA